MMNRYLSHAWLGLVEWPRPFKQEQALFKRSAVGFGRFVKVRQSFGKLAKLWILTKRFESNSWGRRSALEKNIIEKKDHSQLYWATLVERMRSNLNFQVILYVNRLKTLNRENILIVFGHYWQRWRSQWAEILHTILMSSISRHFVSQRFLDTKYFPKWKSNPNNLTTTTSSSTTTTRTITWSGLRLRQKPKTHQLGLGPFSSPVV